MASKYQAPAPSPPGPDVRLRLSATLLVVLLAATFPLGAAAPPAELQARIGEILSTTATNGTLWGVYVQDVSTGDVLYRQNASWALMPASNEKLLTAATALDALGGDYRYQTTLYFDGEVDGNVLRGDLIVRGSGDPTFGSVKSGGPDPLRAWARRLAEIGVDRIEGRIIGEDDAFDDRPYAEGWDIDYITTQASRALGVAAGGLSYNDNVIEVQIEAAGVGDAPKITTRPVPYLDIRNHLTTSSRSRGISVNTDRPMGTETIVMTGSIPRSYAGTIVVPVANPTVFTAQAFRHYLQQAGVEVQAEVLDVDVMEERPELKNAAPLFVYLSPPLSEILKVVNKESNNFYAEQVFRTFGAGGSAAGAERRVKALLAKAGVATEALSIRDGSGLSRKDLVTAEALGRLLAYMNQHPEREAFIASLARGGEPGSTLRYRLNDVPVHAKTGSLEFARALSGYARTTSGRDVAFAVLANNYSMPSYQITQTIDRIVRAVAEGD